ARSRTGAGGLRALHGHAGAVLRALAASDLPDRLPAGGVRDRSPRARGGRLVVWGQRMVYSLHSAMTLSRTDTRNATRAWLVENVAPGTKIVVEPVVPAGGAAGLGNPHPGSAPAGGGG